MSLNSILIVIKDDNRKVSAELSTFKTKQTVNRVFRDRPPDISETETSLRRPQIHRVEAVFYNPIIQQWFNTVFKFQLEFNLICLFYSTYSMWAFSFSIGLKPFTTPILHTYTLTQ